MKKNLQTLTAMTILLCGLTLNMYAYGTYEVDGIYYNTLTDSDGFTFAEVSYGENKYSGDIVIPSTVIIESKTLDVLWIGNDAFKNCHDLTSVTISNGVVNIQTGAFLNCSALKNIIIPNSVKSIRSSAFNGCTSLTSITIPDSVIELEWYALSKCTALKDVTLGNGITNIFPSLFEGCTSLVNVTIPNSITSIGESAFEGCSYLNNISIPSSVKEIRKSAFEGCTNLDTLYVCSTTPPSLDKDSFTNDHYTSTIVYVPTGTLTAYQVADVWKEFMNIQEPDVLAVEKVKTDNLQYNITSNGIAFKVSKRNNVAIYTINGMLVNEIKNYTGEEITLDKGIYIISIGNQNIKIKL